MMVRLASDWAESALVGDKPPTLVPGSSTRRVSDQLYVRGSRLELCVQIPAGYAPDMGYFALKGKTGKRVRVGGRPIDVSGKLIGLGRP
jgi:hypothetical protein